MKKFLLIAFLTVLSQTSRADGAFINRCFSLSKGMKVTIDGVNRKITNISEDGVVTFGRTAMSIFKGQGDALSCNDVLEWQSGAVQKSQMPTPLPGSREDEEAGTTAS